jgi:WD repeat-containing protein 23
MGARVTAQLLHDERYYGTQTAAQRDVRRTRLRDRMGLGALWGVDDDVDDD